MNVKCTKHYLTYLYAKFEYLAAHQKSQHNTFSVCPTFHTLSAPDTHYSGDNNKGRPKAALWPICFHLIHVSWAPKAAQNDIRRRRRRRDRRMTSSHQRSFAPRTAVRRCVALSAPGGKPCGNVDGARAFSVSGRNRRQIGGGGIDVVSLLGKDNKSVPF